MKRSILAKYDEEIEGSKSSVSATYDGVVRLLNVRTFDRSSV
jgi:hypothetical protein